jgi:hypothetical protein
MAGVQLLVSLIRGVTQTLPRQLIPVAINAVAPDHQLTFGHIDFLVTTGIELIHGLLPWA